jgi:succinylglutamate desuccinylase
MVLEMSKKIKRVAIVGGTHGNELTGVYLAKKFLAKPELVQRSSFVTTVLLANPEAIRANRRYIDRDLNRCFDNADLANSELGSYENQLAKAIDQLLGPKTNPQADVILDLHTTTANMGLSILPSTRDPFNFQFAAYLTQLYPEVRVCCGLQCDQDAPMLRSLSPLGCTIEVGAIAQGILDADLLRKTEMLVQGGLDYMELVNQGKTVALPKHLVVYQAIESVDFPRDAEGELLGTIHPALRFGDYGELHPGDPMFLTFEGKTIVYQGSQTVFPVFINEAAYYEKGVAMVLTGKQTVNINYPLN